MEEGGVTHSPGSVCNQAAEAGSSIRALQNCTSLRRQGLRHLQPHMDARAPPKYIQAYTQSDVCAEKPTQTVITVTTITHACTHSAGGRLLLIL